MEQQRNDHRLFSHFNRVGFLHVEYAAALDKYKFFVGQRNNGEMSHDSLHFVDPDDLRYLCYQILSDQLEEWVSRKGGKLNDLDVSRIMVVRHDPKEDKFFLKVGHGPGIKAGNGITLPDQSAPKEAWTFTSLVFTQQQLITMALALRDWLAATTVVELLSLPTTLGENHDS